MERERFEPLDYLARVFGLNDFECRCVESLWKEGGGTKEALLQRLGEEPGAEESFWPGSPLMRYFLIWKQEGGERSLLLDERMEIFLEGELSGYAPYDLLWERVDPSETEKVLEEDPYVFSMEQFLKEAFPLRPLYFYLCGSPGIGRRSRILELCRRWERPLLILDGRLLTEERQELLGAALRECRIYGAWLLIRDLPGDWAAGSLYRERLLAWMGEEAGVIFTIGEEPLLSRPQRKDFSYMEVKLPLPDFAESVRLWERAFLKRGFGSLDPEEWANKFVFTPGQMEEALAQAVRFARAEGRNLPGRKDLQKGCYRLVGGGMGKRAARIEACYTWEELVLPDFQKQKLRDACNQAALRKKVYEAWGFQRKIAYGRGISVVFAGPPGTGKTMAAQVMASELCLDLYRIELAAVVSKYIGETEKNLEEIFEQARKSQVILFFDEADVLFSKRTEVRDSNDKYSNMEAAFLLQKMEEYEGITVLATNYLQNFDEAFKRRMKFIIDFPFPDPGQRLRIWKQVFPRETPVDGELDYEFLASAFELSGSNIKSAALHGAFLAAAEGTGVSMRHLIAGIRNEYAKSGKALSREQLGQYYMLL